MQLAEDDFTDAENIEELKLSHNEIESLNSALLRVRSLRTLNLSHNLLTEFSLQEIYGLQRLKLVDLSHNLIVKLSGRMEVTSVESFPYVWSVRVLHARECNF